MNIGFKYTKMKASRRGRRGKEDNLLEKQNAEALQARFRSEERRTWSAASLAPSGGEPLRTVLKKTPQYLSRRAVDHESL
jgi:hypothetical protein